MPRQKRIDFSGIIHHVIVRGIERQNIFRDDQDRESFLARLAIGLEKTKSRCHAWCLMTNHFHLLIRTGEEPLSHLMRSLLTGYAVSFNKKYKRHGYLFQNRYKSVLCQEEVYFLELLRYIHLNPVRARITRTPTELDRYPWSGHPVLAGKKKRDWQDTQEVLARFGTGERKARQAYMQFIKEGFGMGRRDDLTGGGLIRSAGGWKELEKQRRRKEFRKGDERILGDGSFVEKVLQKVEEAIENRDRLRRKGWDMEKLSQEVCRRCNLTVKDITSRGRKRSVSRARGILINLAYNKLGISGVDIAKFLGTSQPAVTQARDRWKAEVEQYEKILT